MTYRHSDTLVVVFGAGGRLGQTLLPILAAGPWVVVAVARRNKPANPPRGVHWIQVDVTQVDLWERSLRVFCGMADCHERVIIVDLILDKATVTTMRRSLATGTAYITSLRGRLEDGERASSLVLASSTAVLSPWMYQTPYGQAKRRQLDRYASTGVSGHAFLLPSLVDSQEAASDTTRGHPVSTYGEAANGVVQAVAEQTATAPVGLRIPVPIEVHLSDSTPDAQRLSWGRIVDRVLVPHIASWTTQRDSPQVHRLASHGRLALTPRRLRRRVDHHVVPTALLRRLAWRLGAEIEQESP